MKVNLTLRRRGKTPDFVGYRRPEKDDNCPVCTERGRETLAFAYDLTVSGKSIHYHWCPWCQAER